MAVSQVAPPTAVSSSDAQTADERLPSLTFAGGLVGLPDPASYLRAVTVAACWFGLPVQLGRRLARAEARDALHQLERWWARSLCRALAVRLTVSGLEHVDPGETYVITALHEGIADVLALLQLPLPLRFVARDEIFDWPAVGPYLRDTGQLLVCPEQGARSYRRLLRDAGAVLARGESVAIFPQGSILGIETAFHRGAFALARALRRPILPVALTGSHRVWEHPYTPRLRFGQPMSMRVLPPVAAPDVARCDPGELCDELQRALKAAALDGSMVPPRRFVPTRDGYWDGYAYSIDPAFPVETVNKVLAEKQAGKDSGGSVDLMWINGENFRTLKEGGAVFRNWADLLPSSQYVDWTSPAIANDFGYPVEYDESPWGSAQFVMEYDSAKVPDPPKTIAELLAWACENPGRFTYPAPPDFTGSVFVRHVFYAAAGDYTRLLGPFDEATYAPIAAQTWEMLNAVRPCLWRGGATYPESSSALYDLFAQGEVWMAMDYSPTHAANAIARGVYPETTRTWVFDTGTIANTNYVTIPYNSPNKAAAMVVANFLLSPEAQYEAAKPEVAGWSTPLSFARLPQEWAEKFAALPRPAAVLPADVLAARQLAELQASWLTRIEEGWTTNVLEQ